MCTFKKGSGERVIRINFLLAYFKIYFQMCGRYQESKNCSKIRAAGGLVSFILNRSSGPGKFLLSVFTSYSHWALQYKSITHMRACSAAKSKYKHLLRRELGWTAIQDYLNSFFSNRFFLVLIYREETWGAKEKINPVSVLLEEFVQQKERLEKSLQRECWYQTVTALQIAVLLFKT